MSENWNEYNSDYNVTVNEVVQLQKLRPEVKRHWIIHDISSHGHLVCV